MCGFCGWIDWKRNLESESVVIKSMTDSLALRGPDESGIFLSSQAAMGHRRLVVIDPAGGRQPMRRTRGGRTCSIVYNGELYNTEELRHLLQERGWQFQSRNSDTEALLLAYMEWGVECLPKLNGIFSFAVWDHEDQSLFMARDRLGVKPLFYSEREGALVFASEIKALLQNPLIKPLIDESGFAELMVLGPSRTPGVGIFRGINELRPGWRLLYNRSGLKTAPYWTLASHPHHQDLHTTIENVRYLLVDAVVRQTRADVPVAAFLSGGLDSSAITAMAITALESQGLAPIRTFSVDYEHNQDYFKKNKYQQDADFMWVEAAARSLGSRHRSIILNNDRLANALDDAVIANDYPGMGDIDSSLLLFCREVKKEATVALSGECADEIFGGYPWFHWEDKGMAGFPWVRGIEQRLEMINPEFGDGIKRYCRDYLRERYKEAVQEVPELDGENARDAHKRRLFYLCLTRFMPTLLDRKDRMSMAAGLEVRVPFADHRLLEYVWNVPWEMKNCGNQPKGLLRRAMQEIVPEFILQRPKSPYPKTHDPEYLNRVRDRALRIMQDKHSPASQWLHADRLRNIMYGKEEIFTRPWFGQLMGDAQYFAWIIQLNSWLKRYSPELRL